MYNSHNSVVINAQSSPFWADLLCMQKGLVPSNNKLDSLSSGCNGIVWGLPSVMRYMMNSVRPVHADNNACRVLCPHFLLIQAMYIVYLLVSCVCFCFLFAHWAFSCGNSSMYMCFEPNPVSLAYISVRAKTWSVLLYEAATHHRPCWCCTAGRPQWLLLLGLSPGRSSPMLWALPQSLSC